VALNCDTKGGKKRKGSFWGSRDFRKHPFLLAIGERRGRGNQREHVLWRCLVLLAKKGRKIRHPWRPTIFQFPVRGGDRLPEKKKPIFSSYPSFLLRRKGEGDKGNSWAVSAYSLSLKSATLQLAARRGGEREEEEHPKSPFHPSQNSTNIYRGGRAKRDPTV